MVWIVRLEIEKIIFKGWIWRAQLSQMVITKNPFVGNLLTTIDEIQVKVDGSSKYIEGM